MESCKKRRTKEFLPLLIGFEVIELEKERETCHPDETPSYVALRSPTLPYICVVSNIMILISAFPFSFIRLWRCQDL